MEDTHAFGGSWTDEKLETLQGYLSAYTKALKNQRFTKGYIDAFAGTGTREYTVDAKRKEELRRRHDGGQMSFLNCELEDESDPDRVRLLDGSARVALRSQPPFDRYVFIEKSPNRCRQLMDLGHDFPDLAAHIQVRQGDANEVLQEMCSANWREHRAVLFLDPYGMQVSWKTIEAVAATKAIDMWMLFPLGAVVRMLTQSGSMPPSWEARIDSVLGATDWRKRFYQAERSESLFGDSTERFVKASIDGIAEYVVERLNTRFAGVARNPKILRNSRNFPMYLFCFAAANPQGAGIAVQIAESRLSVAL